MGTIPRRIGVLAGLVLSGCAQIASSKVAQSEIYANYSVDYSDESNQVSYRATFSVAGSTGTSVSLDGQSTVSVDGVELIRTTDLFGEIDYTYQKTATAADLTNAHSFIYTDNNGAAYTNSVTVPLDISVDTTTGTVAAEHTPFTVHWNSTDELADTDQVKVTLQKSDETASAIADDYGTGDTSGVVVYTPTQLQPLPPGNYRMMVCRQEWLPVQSAAEAGGNIEISRCLPEIAMMLSP